MMAWLPDNVRFENSETDADRCRRMGWTVGTRLTWASELGHTLTITITAIGEQRILAKLDGRDEDEAWPLADLDWSKVE